MTKEELDRFKEKLRNVLHNIKWESIDNNESSETNLRDCTIDGADMNDNTITVKLNAPNSVSGVILGSKAKISF
jgi:hypothetical protein